MNPWEQKVLDRSRSVLRFSLWTTIVINGLMLATFSVCFLALLLWRTWFWVYAHWFSHPW